MKRRGAGTLSREDIGSRVLLQAWAQRRRDHGGVLFLDLRDRSGVAQVVAKPDVSPEALAALDPVRSEWVVEVEGVLAARETDAINPKMATGEVELLVDRAVVLSKCDALPFPIDGPPASALPAIISRDESGRTTVRAVRLAAPL